MLTISRFIAHYSNLPKPLLELLVELRNIVAGINPQACEEMRRQGVVYYDAKRGGPVTAGICQLLIFSDHIRLAFIHGIFLPDPNHLLEGSNKVKKFIRLVSFETTPWEYITNMIRAHNAFDPYTQTFRNPQMSLDKEPL